MKNNAAKIALRFAAIFLIFSMIPLPAAAGERAYSAIVMDVNGKAFVLHATVKKAIDLGCLLYSGDSVETTQGASVIITYLESGQEETWPGGAKFVVDKNGSNPAPAKINKRDRIILPQISSPQKGSFTLRGRTEYADLKVESLSNTSTIEERPEFRWSPQKSAKKYRIRLYLSSQNELLWQRTTKDEELSFPSDVSPLNPGDRYTWVIEAFDDGNVVAKKSSCFNLPPNTELAEIKIEADSYLKQLDADSSDTMTRFRYILFLEEHRIYDEALKQYGILQKQHRESESLKDRRTNIIELRSMTCQSY